MKNFAVIGSPISHSLSPAMHADFIDELGVAARYEAIDGAEFAGDLRAIFAAKNLAGANVTLPYKTAALELASEASEAARACGAANTLLRRADGSFFAHNTDVAGFLAPLRGENLAGAPVLVLGAGGAARAVVFALELSGAAVSLLARRPDNELGAPTELAREEFFAVINATSASLRGELPADSRVLARLKGVCIAYDLVYGQSAFLDFWPASVRKIDGMPMLAYQAAAAAELFYGKAPSESLVQKWAARQ